MLAGGVESELLHTYIKVDPFDVLILCVRVAVLTAVTLTVPIVLFPVSDPAGMPADTATPGCHRALAPGFQRGNWDSDEAEAWGQGGRDRWGCRD